MNRPAYIITQHAVDRYIERVKQAASPVQAKQEILALLNLHPFSDLTQKPPSWATTEPQKETGERYYVEIVKDSVVVALLRDDKHPDRFFAMTLLCRGHIGESVRGARSDFKRRKRRAKRIKATARH